MENSLWNMDYIQLQNLSEGILKLSYIKGVEVKDTRAVIFKKGEIFKNKKFVKENDLSLLFYLTQGFEFDKEKVLRT